MGRVEEIGFASSAGHKPIVLRPMLQKDGVGTRWLRVDADLPELELASPSRVLARKLVDTAEHYSRTLDFLAQIGSVPHALMVGDVLGLLMPGAIGGQGSIGQATKVLKKARIQNPIYAAAEHFADMYKVPTGDGWHWSAYGIGAAIAPVDYRGKVDLNRAVRMWDSLIWVGYSHALVSKMSDPREVSDWVERGILPSKVFDRHSIEGLKTEMLLRSVGELAVRYPNDGLAMRMIYRGADYVVDSPNDTTKMREWLHFVDAAMANATPGLARQIISTVGSWA